MELYYVARRDPRVVSMLPVDDPFYRYKTRQLVVEGASRNRTAFPNLDAVAKCLKTSPRHMLAYFQYTLGANTDYAPQRPPRERAFISGAVSPEAVDACMRQFITDMVVCPVCEYAELVTSVQAGVPRHQCKSCGYSGEVRAAAKFVTHLARTLK